MMIDFHTHPLLVREMHKKHPELARIARDVFHIGNNPQPLETFLLEMDVSGIEKAVILPIDATTAKGHRIYSNEQIAELCGERLIHTAAIKAPLLMAPWSPGREGCVAFGAQVDFGENRKEVYR